MPSQIAYNESLEISLIPYQQENCKGCSLNFFSEGKESADLLVTSMGKVVYENRIQIRSGVNQVRIKMKDFSAGTYELSMLTPSRIRRKRFRLT